MLGWTMTMFLRVGSAGFSPDADAVAVVVFPGRRRSERAAGTSNIPMAHQAVDLSSVFLDHQFQASRKSRTFTRRTQRLPPLVPVNSYHCTQRGWLANTFPTVSQGQLSPQFCRCRYSKLSQKATRDAYPILWPQRFL